MNMYCIEQWIGVWKIGAWFSYPDILSSIIFDDYLYWKLYTTQAEAQEEIDKLQKKSRKVKILREVVS